MIFFVILLVFLVVWFTILLFVKQEARALISKYSTPLPWIRSNSIIMMIRKLQELKVKGLIEEKEDGRDCNIILWVLKGTLIIFPIVMIFIIIATSFMKSKGL